MTARFIPKERRGRWRRSSPDRGRIDGLGKLKMPTLVIHGVADVLVPGENGKQTADAIPDSELLMIDGHGPRHPARVVRADLIRDRRERVEGGLERMAEYIEVAEAVDQPGMRLALSAGVPGPWGESAKSIFDLKGIQYLRVRQLGGGGNDALREWTGRDNAPVAVYNDEPARDGWSDILALAERLAPANSLIPEGFDDRTRMFGLCHAICSPFGFGWNRRTLLLAPMYGDGVPAPAQEIGRRLGDKYGFSQDAVKTAKPQVITFLRGLSAQLLAQREAGSPYLIGDALTAADIYWACFAALLEPMSEQQCAMSPMLRAGYTVTDPEILDAADPILLEHRDAVYAKHLQLPMEF